MEEIKFNLDRYGCCPNCKTSWDGGDLFESLRSLDLYKANSDEEIQNIARNYGWTPENRIHSSRLIGIEIRGLYDGVAFYRCPNTLCNSTWSRFTGELVDRFYQPLNKQQDGERDPTTQGPERSLPF